MRAQILLKSYTVAVDILIIGAGGREHSLAWKLQKSPLAQNIFVAPGNAGTAKIAKNLPLSEPGDILDWIRANNIGLVVVGPDNYLVEGIVDKIQEMNVPVFGPTKDASEIEWSKSFAKDFMKQEGIPTAKYNTFNNFEKAKKYVQNESLPLVVKASGLAFGKGVVIAKTREEAEIAVHKMMREKVFGGAGEEVIIEEYLEGVEISTHAFCDGKDIVMFPPAQDRKSVFENDKGPNTGGMGTVAPVSTVRNDQMNEIKEKIVLPTVQGLERAGRPFKGVLFPGIMLTRDGPKVIEFNARFGDPEAQSYMRILESDLLPILIACVEGSLHTQKINWANKFACCVVLASKGYPGKYKKGEKISGLEDISDTAEIFHAGTINSQAGVTTNGGRVLGVTNIGESLSEALKRAYRDVEKINFNGMQFRRDIGVVKKITHGHF